MITINKIYNESNLITTSKMDDNSIDLTITSPPYDNLRTYNGYCFDFENLAKELYRITKDGGIVVWNVADSIENGSETMTSFKQALYFVEQCGFKLWDTMIWHKTNPMNLGIKPRYTNAFEYMFVLSKGNPKTFNPILEKSKSFGKSYTTVKKMSKVTGPEREKCEPTPVNEFKMKDNVWSMGHAARSYGHPAPFPEKLVENHILSWTNKNDVVYDPFMGSGTTASVSLRLGRKYIGSEISLDYVDKANERIKGICSSVGMKLVDGNVVPLHNFFQ